MVLSSQSPRSGSGRSYLSGRNPGGGKWKAVVVLLVIGVLGYWFVFRDTAGTTNADTGSSVAGAAAPSDQEAAGEAPPTPLDASPRPAVASEQPDASAAEPIAEASVRRQPPKIDETSAVSSAGGETPAPAAPLTAGETGQLIRDGLAQIELGNLVGGRAQLSALLFDEHRPLAPGDAGRIRDVLTDVNSRLVFSAEITPNDPVASAYTVQPNDRLGSIARRYKVPYPFLELINSMDARRMRVGQRLKLIQGPVHARVSKSGFLMDMFVHGEDGAPVYLCSFQVGLGANDGTPTGKWLVASGKVTNPDWRNPQTNEYYTADNPDNPIGEYWVPISGVEGDAVGRTGFGLHGTIDPDSIGKMKSMGCIRLADADIALVYNMLEPRQSTVTITP